MTRLTLEEFKARLMDVAITHVDGQTILNHPGEPTFEGVLSYTNGLTDLVGYELVSFGAYDPEDLMGSAQLIFGHFPRGAALPIPYDMLLEANPEMPPGDYRQYFVDESALHDENEKVGEEPLWIPEGGYSLLPWSEVQTKLQEIVANQDVEQLRGIEQTRQLYRDAIEKNRMAIVAVFDPKEQVPNFAYTVGLTHKGLPELGISGLLDMDFLTSVVGHFATLELDEGHALRSMEKAFKLDTGSEHNLRLVEVDPVYATENYLKQAGPILKQAVTRVCQIQISDAAGRFDGDPLFDNQFRQAQFGPVISGGTPNGSH